MLNFIRRVPPTDFELRNPEARSAYQIREAKKVVAKILAATFAVAVLCTAASSYLEKKYGNAPFEDA